MRYPREHHEPTASIRRFIAAGIDPFVDEWEADAIFPAHEPFEKMGRPGFPGSTQAEEYGGMGFDFSYALAAAEAPRLGACAGRRHGRRRAVEQGHGGARGRLSDTANATDTSDTR